MPPGREHAGGPGQPLTTEHLAHRRFWPVSELSAATWPPLPIAQAAPPGTERVAEGRGLKVCGVLGAWGTGVGRMGVWMSPGEPGEVGPL